MVSGRRERALWRAYSSVYDTLWDTPLTERLAQRVCEEVPATGPVEDVGAGTGLVTTHLVAAGHEVVAHEPHAGMRRRFMRRLPHVTIDELAVDDLRPDGVSRTVVAVNVVHLAGDANAAVERLRRRAGPGGRVVVATPSPDVSVLRVARAQQRAGGTTLDAIRFVVLHLLLAPLVAVAGGGPQRGTLELVGQLGSPAVTVDETSWLLTFEGV